MAKRVLVVAGREGIPPALQAQVNLWAESLEINTAASGNEALWEIRGSPYDLVLSPSQLPEMNGMEFAEVVQALSPATKVVLTEALITPPLQSQAERLHLYALLPEVSADEVTSLVSRALGVPLPQPKPASPPWEAAPVPVPAPVAGPGPETSTQPVPPAAPSTPGVTLSPAQRETVRRALRDLLASVGPQVAFLADLSGEPLVLEGNPGDLPLPALASPVASSLSGLGELGRLLDDGKFLGLSLFTGTRYDIYTFTITEATSLFLVFDKRVVESKLGSVWLYTRRMVEELRGALS